MLTFEKMRWINMRADGRRTKGVFPMYQVAAHIMDKRYDSQNMITLDIPLEPYTPIFAIARIVGWSAHRIEELICTDKIIRPAYMSVMEEK